VKCVLRVALGVAGGYFLGRNKKLGLALMLGGMAAGGQAGGPGELLRSGTKLLSSSPELSRLTDEVRGRLLEAGKGAVLAVAARQVESLTDRVGKRVESFGDGGVPRRGKKAEPEPETDEYAEDEGAEDEYAEDEGAEPDDFAEDEETAEAPEPPPPARPRSERAAPVGAGKNAATATLKRRAAPVAGAAGKVAAGRRSGRPADSNG
jgi:hypothetical protein